MQHGNFGLGTLFRLWTLLFQSLRTPLTMIPFHWLNMGSFYLTFTSTWTPFAIVGYVFSKTIISCLITSANSTPLDILIPWVATSCSII